jgi:hypothetical protein
MFGWSSLALTSTLQSQRSFFTTSSSFPLDSFKVKTLLTIIDVLVELMLLDLPKDNIDTESSYGTATIC